MVLTVFAGIAEFERALIVTRTGEGRRAAQARGVPFGRPPKLRPEQRALARHLIEEGKSVSEVARSPMSMSQRSIAAYATRRPYDSTPFLSHARSVSQSQQHLTPPKRLAAPSDLRRHGSNRRDFGNIFK